MSSPDVGRVLRLEEGIADTSFSYNIECAQRKQVQVRVRIYDMNRNLVYEVTEQKVCPGNYSFTWDGTVNAGYYEYPPEEWSNIAPASLYAFDVEVKGPAYYYDADWLRSRNLKVGEHKVKFITSRVIEGWYVLYSNRDASEAWMEVYDPDFEKVTEVTGTTHAIPENTTPTEQDWNKTGRAWVGFDKIGTWFFVFWAKDNFPDFDKAHRKKICLPLNTERPKGWILSYGYIYADGLDTTRLADSVAGIVSNIKVGSEVKPGYERVESNASDPLNVAKEIGEVAAVRRDTKRMPGLIHFAGHGAYRDERGVVRFTNAIQFPNVDSCGHKWLGIVPKEKEYTYMVHNVESIREYAKGNDKSLKNVQVVLLLGRITGHDLPQKFYQLGAKVAIGTKRIMHSSFTSDPALYFHNYFAFAFWRSLALGSYVQNAVYKGIDSVNKVLNQKGYYY